MILDFSAYEYYIRPGVTDSRKSWRTPAEMADTLMGMSIREKAMFLFCNRSRNCIKILAWDNGYWVLMKRIPKGTFAWLGTEEEAKAFYAVLPKRLAKFGLEIAEDKTRILPFGKGSGSKESFEFLGFSFRNGMSHKNFYVVVVLSSKKKMKAKRQAIKEWLYSVMHFPISDIVAKLNVKLLGHYHYYGVSGNTKSLSSFRSYCIKTLYRVLRRRG